MNNWKNSYQTTGGPPSKSWSLPKGTLRTQQINFTIKTQKRSFYIIWQWKMAKQSKIVFVSNTLVLLLLLSYCMTTTVVFIRFKYQVVYHRRVEPLLKSTNYINGALTAEMERANNHPAQQPKPSCQEFNSWRGKAWTKPMFLIRPSLAANTITAKSPIVFVQDRVPDRVPD